MSGQIPRRHRSRARSRSPRSAAERAVRRAPSCYAGRRSARRSLHRPRPRSGCRSRTRSMRSSRRQVRRQPRSQARSGARRFRSRQAGGRAVRAGHAHLRRAPSSQRPEARAEAQSCAAFALACGRGRAACDGRGHWVVIIPTALGSGECPLSESAAPLPRDVLANARRMRSMDRRSFLLGASSLALAPRLLARLPSSKELALVTADEEARLVAVELASGRVQRYVKTLPKPRSIESVGGMAVVAHSEIGAITIVRGRTLAVAHVLHGFGEPRYTAGHPDGRHAYVSDAARCEVVALDVLEGRVLGRARVGNRARHVTIDPSGTTLWVALGAKAKRVAVVDVRHCSQPGFRSLITPPF